MTGQVVRDQLLTVAEVSEMTGLVPAALYGLRAAGKGPQTIRLGGRVVYRRSDVQDWLSAGD